MLLNVIRGAAIAAALGLISTAGAGATLRAVSVHPLGAPLAAHKSLTGLTARIVLSSNARLQANSCPSSQYSTCVTTQKGNPATVTWTLYLCSSSGSCYQSPTAIWSSTAYKNAKKGPKLTKKIASAFDPNPGNPSVETISTTSGKASKVNGYVVAFQGCAGSSSSAPCSGGTIGVTIEAK
jgi:hypothetical protein